MGTVVISIDAELGWGHHDLPDPPAPRVEYARTGWLRLLDLLADHDLPATWAVVGHLLETDCDGRHADHPVGEAWFARERGEWIDRPDLRFGRALVERVVAADQSHELGGHSYSHVEFRDGTTRAVARAEVGRNLRAAADAGLLDRDDDSRRSMRSFVFPRNWVGHREALVEHGFTCYRGLSPTREGRSGLAQAGRKVAETLTTPPPVVRPSVDEHGLVNVPASMQLFDFEGWQRALAEPVVGDPVVVRARRAIDAVAGRQDGVVHFWLHPNNVYAERHARRLRAVFGYLAARRDAGAVRVETMGSVARETLDACERATAPGATG